MCKLVLVQLGGREILPQKCTFLGVITVSVNRLEKEGGLFANPGIKVLNDERVYSDYQQNLYPTSWFTDLSQIIRA